ncbi:MAG: CBS domain-containing protein [Candidatus Jacksonbacteria bacterium]
MPYLSQLLNNKVKDSGETVAGRLADILIAPQLGIYAPIKFLMIKQHGSKKDIFLPYEYVETLGQKTITLKHLLTNIPVRDAAASDLIYLRRQVMDQQIVDISGARVVRVNDVRLGIFEGHMSILGIDVSLKGLLRRLGLDWLDFGNIWKTNLIDWRETQPVHGFLRLNIISKDLNKLHPADLANIIEDLSLKQGSHLVNSLETKQAAQVLEEVSPEFQKILIKNLRPKRINKVLAQMSTDEITDLLKSLPREEAERFLEKNKHIIAQKVNKLIKYPDNTAGGLMTLDFMNARPNWTVAETIEQIKKASPSLRYLLYVYVTNKKGYFYGAASLRSLLISPPDKKIKKLLKKCPPYSVLRPNQRIPEIVNMMTKYNLFTAAVVDKKNKLLGLVGVDDVMRCLAPNA